MKRDREMLLTSNEVRLLEAAPDLLKALEETLRAYEQLILGIRYIAVQDYANINQAPILARAAIAKAKGKRG